VGTGLTGASLALWKDALYPGENPLSISPGQNIGAPGLSEAAIGT
jgi:hypothetical protein